MTICILGNGLTALTLAKALTKQNIYVDVLYNIKNSVLLFEIPIVLVLLRFEYFSLYKTSTYIFWLVSALAKVNAVKPLPSMQIVILFLILTIKIRWYKVIKLIHLYGY